VSTGSKLLAYTPGADTPGLDVEPKLSSRGWKLTSGLEKRDILFGTAGLVSGRLSNASGSGAGGNLELQADPYPFDGGWRTAAVEKDPTVSSYAFRVRPDRNTRYRVVYDHVDPPLVTTSRTLNVDLAVRIRYLGYAPGRVRALISVRGPKDARLARRQISMYLVRRGVRYARRLARGRLKLIRPGLAKRTLRFYVPRLRSRDYVVPCLKEPKADAWGRWYRYERHCGRLRL
jgi:hypothetical protein